MPLPASIPSDVPESRQPHASMADAERAALVMLRGLHTTHSAGVLVATSGGADSALLLSLVAEVWGPAACLAVTSRSESLPVEELEAARAQAAALNVEHVALKGAETDIEAFQRNDVDRCFHCKWHLYGELARVAQERGLTLIVDGSNADDGAVGDERPGMEAARIRNVHSPLRDAGVTKVWVRAISKARGLDTWDKPAEACLSSRFPYGTRVTKEGLARVYRAERVLRNLGFRTVRVRVHDPIARIELGPEELAAALAPGIRERIVAGVEAEGFTYVTLDLAGFRSGNLNQLTSEPGTTVRAHDQAGHTS